MAKFCGYVGFAVCEETVPGVWKDQVTEKKYYGDIIRNSRRWEKSENLNDNLNINNQISIIADPYARENFHLIKYVKFMGNPWCVTNVEVEYPRLTLTLGGVYNGEQA